MTEEIIIIDNDPVPDELLDKEIVLEAGAYEGAWIKKVCEQRTGCVVFAFEPATRAYEVALRRLKDCAGVDLRNVALGKADGTAELCDRDRDGANTFAVNPEHRPSETVHVVDVADVIRPLGEIAVAHLNAEGDEVTILERLLEVGLIERIRVLLVQWHPYDDEMRARIEAVTGQLAETHAYEHRGPWGCWKRKEHGGTRLPGESRRVHEVSGAESDRDIDETETGETETIRKEEA